MVSSYEIYRTLLESPPERLSITVSSDRRRSFQCRADTLQIFNIEGKILRTGLRGNINTISACLLDQSQAAGTGQMNDMNGGCSCPGNLDYLSDSNSLHQCRPVCSVVSRRSEFAIKSLLLKLSHKGRFFRVNRYP